MPAQPTEIQFPIKGFDEGWAHGRQPQGTTPACSNVVAFDAIDARARGGQRWGITKYFPFTHNGSASIQRLTTITDVLASAGGSITEAFTQANGVLDNTLWDPCEWDFAGADDSSISASVPRVVSNVLVTDDSDDPDTSFGAGAWYKTPLTINPASVTITASVSFTASVAASSRSGIKIFPFASEPSFPAFPDPVSYMEVLLTYSGGALNLSVRAGGGGNTVTVMTPGSADYLDPTWWQTERTLTIQITGKTVTVSVDGTLLLTDTVIYNGLEGAYLGFVIRTGNIASDATTLDDLTVSSISTTGRSYKLVSVSGGDVYAGSTAGGDLTVATNGANALATSGRVDMQTAFTKIYMVDGDPANYRYFDNSDDTVYRWTASGTGAVPSAGSATALDITAATPGTPSFTIGEDWSARVAGERLFVSGSTANDGDYTVASVSGSGPTVITVNETVADNTVDGTIQLQDEACKIIRLYRGRIAMAGLKSDPHNWFLSAAGDPLDWDYGATPVSATMAVAGNNTDAGLCPDIITCLAPFSDDLMYIGGDHTLWIMRGDPADGGRIDNISYQTGIAGPDAFTFDPNGVFYFFGNGALWRLQQGGSPDPISSGRLDKTFQAIDLTTHTVELHWDSVRQGLFLFVIPTESGATTHYFWDSRTDGFWPISFPNDQGPTTAYAYDGDNPNDHALLLGGWDGFIRFIDPSVSNDDGTAISSNIQLPAISAGGPLRNTKMNRITATLDSASNDVTLDAYQGDTVQRAVESSTLRFSRTLIAGRTVILNRISGNAIVLKLSNTTVSETWAFESMFVNLEVTGRTRGGKT